MRGKSLSKEDGKERRNYCVNGCATPMRGKSLSKEDGTRKDELLRYGSATPMRGKSLSKEDGKERTNYFVMALPRRCAASLRLAGQMSL